MVSRGGTAAVRFGVWLLPLGLVAVWAAGCQEPAAMKQKPAVQAQAEAGVPAGQKAAPAASEMQTVARKPAAAKAPAGQPKITVEKDTWEMGDIGINSRHKGQFKFTNTGNAPLKIAQVQSCCGVVTKGVEAGQEYAPGQSGTLEVDYRAPDVTSPMLVKTLYLQTNDPNQAVTTLTIKATVVRRVICKPEVLRLFLNKPNAGCTPIALTSLDGRPFSVTGFQTTGNTITAQFDPNEKGTEFVLQPQVDLARLEKNMRGQISIDLTHPDCNNVRVMYDTLPEFEVSTPTIMMFGLKPGQAVQREFWILNNYGESFEIESVSSQKGTIKLLDEKMAGNRCQLRVEMTPGERNPESTVVSDTLEIKIKNNKTLTIPFRGFYQ